MPVDHLLVNYSLPTIGYSKEGVSYLTLVHVYEMAANREPSLSHLIDFEDV